MATNTLGSIDFAQLQQKLSAQFSGLDFKDPASWPALPQYALFLVLSIAIVTGLWFVWLTGEDDILKQEAATELTLRADYKVKLHAEKFDDADWDERPAHRAAMTAPFAIGATEVTLPLGTMPPGALSRLYMLDVPTKPNGVPSGSSLSFEPSFLWTSRCGSFTPYSRS